MDEQPITATGCVIFPFPARAPQPSEQERLDRALRGLLQAAKQQAAAVAAWRGAIGALHDSVQDLAASVGRYEASLARAATQVRALGEEARRLRI